MTTRFYRCETPSIDVTAVSIQGLSIRIWQPCRDGLPRYGALRWANLVWWTLQRLGLFARDDFAELTIWREEQLLHRLIVTPRWYRFPFMTGRDLQIGALWTHPAARGRGLARAAIGEALRRFDGKGGRFWYVVDSTNHASIRLIESCGFELVGTGRRTHPLGLRLFGRFRLDSMLA